MNEGSKCLWCPNCPYYEQTTSYGTERIRCANTNCILYEQYIEEENEEEKTWKR